MSKELITKAEEIRDEVRVGANTSRRVGGFLEEIAREVNGLYENVLDWINNEKPQGGGYILTQSDVVDGLDNESQLKPLSAKQGMILKAILDAMVIDNLTTEDETKALSARQGKNLADEIGGLSVVYQPLGDYADALHTHTAGQVTEEPNKRFMTDAERTSLSSLGTYAKADFSNITSKSMGQNGYYKLPDGLLIQWGISPGTLGVHDIILPISFSNSDYIITSNIQAPNTSENVMISTFIYTKYSGFFKAFVKCEASTWSAWRFNWFAIGRWK